MSRQLALKHLAIGLGNQTQKVLKDFNIGNVRIAKVTRGIKHLTLKAVLAHPKDLKVITSEQLTDSLALSCGLNQVSSYRAGGFVNLSYLLPYSWHLECLYRGMAGRQFGVTDSNQPVEYALDDTGPHMLICGTSGSGKNFTASAIILSMSKEEPNTEFVFVDPHKQFTEFNHWIQLAQPIAQNQLLDIERNVNYVYEEFLKREFLELHEIDALPRLVLVVDEFESKITSTELQEKISAIVVGGRKFKIHLMAISQKPTEKKVGGILSGLTQIYLGKVKSKRIGGDLSGFPGLEAHKLDGKGDFLKILGSDVTRFQVGKVTNGDFSVLERGEKSFVTPNLPKELRDLDPDKMSRDDLIQRKKMGRPKRELKPDVVAYLLANKNVSVRQAIDSMKLNNNSYYEYKAFRDELENILKNVYKIELCDI